MTVSRRVKLQTDGRGVNKTVSRSRERRQGGEVVSSEESVDKTPVNLERVLNPAYVRVGGGVTKNMGDYNSIRVNVEISMPCLPNEEAIKETYNETSGMVEEMIDNEMQIAEGEN